MARFAKAMALGRSDFLRLTVLCSACTHALAYAPARFVVAAQTGAQMEVINARVTPSIRLVASLGLCCLQRIEAYRQAD